MIKIIAWMMEYVFTMKAKLSEMFAIARELWGIAAARILARARAMGGASGMGAAAAKAANAFSKTAASSKGTWWSKFFNGLGMAASTTGMSPKSLLVNGLFFGLPLYLSYRHDGDSHDAAGGKMVTVNNIFDREYDVYDRGSSAYKALLDEASRDAKFKQITGLFTGHELTDAEKESLLKDILNQNFQHRAMIENHQLSRPELEDFITNARLISKHQGEISDSITGRWLRNAICSTKDGAYLYEDGQFMDYSTSELLKEETLLRDVYVDVLTPVMRQLGVGSLRDLRPLLSLVTMDPDLFTAIERTMEIWEETWH